VTHNLDKIFANKLLTNKEFNKLETPSYAMILKSVRPSPGLSTFGTSPSAHRVIQKEKQKQTSRSTFRGKSRQAESSKFKQKTYVPEEEDQIY